MYKRRLSVVLYAALVSTTHLPAIAVAQPGGGGPTVLEEIVVTARFREESLQDIGASFSAYDGETIGKSGLVDLSDLSLRTVGLDVLDLGPSANDVNIRGVTNAAPGGGVAVGLGALVVTFIDDVSISGFGSGRSMDISMFDLNRVEVLRGPQPTYFGEGSVGGTLRYFSADPSLDGDIDGKVQITGSSISDGGESYSLEGAITIPLVENQMALRLMAFRQDEAGFVDAPAINADDINGYELTGGRATLLWEPTERFTGRLSYHFGRLDRDDGFEIDPTQDLSDLDEDNLISSATSVATATDDYDLFSLKLSYDFGALTVESISGYVEREFRSSGVDTANTVAFRLFLGGLFGVTDIDTTTQSISQNLEESFTQEFRFVSNFNGPLNFTAGLYYKNSDTDESSVFESPGLSVIVVPPTARFADVFTAGSTEQTSAFIEGTFEINDAFRIIAGARYVEEDFKETLEKSLVLGLGSFLGIDPATGYPLFPISNDLDTLAAVGLSNSFEFSVSETLPRVGFEYDLSEDILLYANYARGLRNGGLNPIVSAVFQALDPITFEVDQELFVDAVTYTEDEVDTVEVGVKTRLLNGAATVNVAAYVTDYQNPQVLIGVPTVAIDNAPDEDIWGLELETSWLINENLSTFFNVSYLDAEFTDGKLLFTAPGAPEGFVDLQDGNRPPNTPEWTLSAGVDISYPMRAGLTFVGHGSFSFVDKRFSAAQNFPVGEMGSMEILNFRGGIAGESWRVTAFVNNALNDLELQGALAPSNGAFINADGVLDANLSQAFINRPRTIGLQVAFDF